MRIDRVRLKNFAGVSEAEVWFAPAGVTIVHGANETGKSTLMQGINVLLDHLDTSNKEEVKNTKPVNRDVGAEVEADIEVGVYRFTYFKRFHKQRETRLTILAPKAESLSGREAHERVQQMLASSLDTQLWRALRIEQGQSLATPKLHNQPALAQALDRVAGQAKSGEAEEALYEAVNAEFRNYFTDGGKEREAPMGRARVDALSADARVVDLRAQLRALEDGVNTFANRQLAAATQRRGLEALTVAHAKALQDWEAVAKLAADAERAAATQQLAVSAVRAADGEVQRRNALIESARIAQADARTADAEWATAAANLQAASQRLKSVRVSADDARAAASRCDADANVRQVDLKFREDEFALQLLEERLMHVRDADAEASSASALLAAARITAKLRNSIRDAELALNTAQGVLNVASPQLTITALQPISMRIDGAAQSFAATEARVLAVSETVVVQVSELVLLQVEPGTSAAIQRQAVHQAQTELERLCASAGVATPDAAEAAWQALEAAKRSVANRDRVASQHLRDLTREQFAQLIATTRAAVAAYQTNRSSELPLPASIELAKAAQLHSAQASAAARGVLAELDASLEPLQADYGQCAEAHAAKAALLQRAQQDAEQLGLQLHRERDTASDAALADAQKAAQLDALRARSEVSTSRDALGARDPESIKAVLDSASPALSNARERSSDLERELIELRTRLEVLGDKGLADALADAERAAFEANDALERLLRRANAARLLLETLRAARDAMRKAYVAPLREGIERLGRLVFGPTLRVEVDDKLDVVSRTVDGITVGLEQLSTGAREQMGLLVRLAAAAMVSSDGGVPLVLDDALGSTDEVRAEAIGAVLRIASRNVQTIILTCSPERYVHVGAVRTVRL